MSFKRFSNQTSEQVAAHLSSFLGGGNFDIEIDSFEEVARISKSSGHGRSHKIEKLQKSFGGMKPHQRRKAMSAKRREKPKLKHVRNGRAITLKGYVGWKPFQQGEA